MFRHGSHVQLKVIIGNHDVGFHYQMSKYRIKRFEKVFGSERLFSLKGVNFVMVNSVAMEGDGCTICSEEEAELREISRKLNCSQEVGDLCTHVSQRRHSQGHWLLVTQLLFPLPVVATEIDG